MPTAGTHATALRTRQAFQLLAALALALTSPVAAAYLQPGDARLADSRCTLENDRHFVYDFVGLLDADPASYVEDRACDLYQEDGAHLVLAIVPDLGGEPLDDYAPGLVRDWGIGDSERLDGLLVLYTLDDGSGQDAMRVEVGYGLESVVNAVVAREAVDAARTLKANQLANGSTEREAAAHAVAAAASGLAIFTQANHEGVAGERSSSGGDGGIPWWIVVLVVVLLLVLVVTAARRGGGGGNGGPGGRGGWGGSGGGSGGFGGGKSGGGGWGGKL